MRGRLGTDKVLSMTEAIINTPVVKRVELHITVGTEFFLCLCSNPHIIYRHTEEIGHKLILTDRGIKGCLLSQSHSGNYRWGQG